MNQFKEMFDRQSEAFIPFVMLGDPDLDTSASIIDTLIYAGADGLELGIPFSDPIADGHTIQQASARALNSGATLERCLNIVERVRAYSAIPIGLLTYANLIARRGFDEFAQLASSSGVDAVLAADISFEESQPWLESLGKKDLESILLVALNTPLDRALEISQQASAFTYVLNLFGPTGSRGRDTSRTLEYTRKLSMMSSSPLVCGFGVDKPSQAKALYKAGASGVIVGSALINHMQPYYDQPSRLYEAVRIFVSGFKNQEVLEPC